MRHRSGHRGPSARPAGFDTLADRYDRLHDLQADPLGTWLPGALPQHGRRALDADCGNGRHTLLLADRFEEVIGIDLSAPMIGLATARRPRPNIAYRHADLMEFWDPDGFDLVLSVNTLHHLPDLDGALDHLRRLTRPAGLVVLVDCVARRPTLPRWWFVGGAVRDLLVDLARRPTHARELWGLRTDPAWLDHLTRTATSAAPRSNAAMRRRSRAHASGRSKASTSCSGAPQHPDDGPAGVSGQLSAEDMNSYHHGRQMV
jgi:SAM-dependent methyltransferase